MKDNDFVRSILNVYFNSSLTEEILDVSSTMELEKDSMILDTGATIHVIPFVLEGSVKVFKEDDEGHEILIYYLLSGDTCALTLNSCIMREESKIKAMAESRTKLLLIPSDRILHWIDRYPEVKHFLITVFNRRFENLLDTIQILAFNKLDQRIMSYLKNKAEINKTEIIETTHQQIANELGTSREVISRVLKQLEKQNLISISRHEIKIQ